MTNTRYLDALMEMHRDRGRDVIFACIRDLAVNGLSLCRFSVSDSVPNRQDVTQYLAAWCRYAGMSEDACRDWLTEYCVEMLSPISKTIASGIRHSTKSNVRYIYRSQVAFGCGRESNRCKAHCSKDCPVYADMATETNKVGGQDLSVLHNARPSDVSAFQACPVKDLYREQFGTALQLVRRELRMGTKKKIILDLLNQQGLKTRTGRKWTYFILYAEIRKMEGTPEFERDGSGSGTCE